jgi:hypothetical protein
VIAGIGLAVADNSRSRKMDKVGAAAAAIGHFLRT